MALIRTPSPLPTPLDYVPPNSEPANVGARDSWWSLAERPGARAAGLSALDLCYFNFGTRRPTEINWYLKNKVGCTTQTRDGDNYTFASCKFPDKVYIPKIGVIPPPNEYPKPVVEPDTIRKDVWFGFAAKYSLHLVVGGFDLIRGGTVWNIGSMVRHADQQNYSAPGFHFSAQVGRAGIGVGGGVGMVLVVAAGLKSINEFRGFSSSEIDWNLSTGGKLKGILNSPKLFKLAQIASKISSHRVAGKLISLDPDSYVELHKGISALLEASKTNKEGAESPKIMIIDTPAAVGLEASIFKAETRITDVWPM